MIEHRLIEQIVSGIDIEQNHIAHDKIAHSTFIYNAADFFRTYADKFHHGKEEDILFVELKKKPLSLEHESIINELKEEHIYARKTVGELVSATEKWSNGDKESLVHISDSLGKLSDLYPRHIRKEDKEFFMPCQKYFNKAERKKLLEKGYAFDKNFTNIIYKEKMKSILAHGK